MGVSYSCAVCSRGDVVAVDGGGGRTGPVFDVGPACEKESANALAGDAYSTLGDAVELMDMCGSERASCSVVVAELEETRADEFAAVVRVDGFDGVFDRGVACIRDCFEVGE